MKRVSNWAVRATLFLGIGFIALNLGSPKRTQAQSESASPSRRCSNATLHGTYVYSSTGYISTASTPFAFAGSEVFGGDGTIHAGFTTTTTEGQPISRTTYTGTYHVNSNCTVTEIDTDNHGNVMHFDEFTGPDGNKFTFIETDPNVVASGFETRVSGGQNQP